MPGAPRNLFLSVVVIWLATATVNGQAEAPTIKVSVSSPDLVKIDIHSSRPQKNWSFLNAYGGAMSLGSRILEFQATGVSGETVPIQNVAPGEFRTDATAVDLSYSVRLIPPDAGDVAHISWLMPEYGFLMFADLLPRDLHQAVFAEFSLPKAWGIHTALRRNEKHQFVVEDPVKAVFLVGQSLRTVPRKVEGMNFDFAFTGNWPFKEDRVAKSASTLLKMYFQLTGFRLPKKSIVMIAPVPVANSNIKWIAETRGSTLILLLDPRAPFRNWVAQLEVIFTHELLHLWVPNSLWLEGDYDWFFEGFTLYEALLTARESKVISFQEYLDTLARVYDSYLSNPDRFSLIEASEQRWSSGSSAVYDKGMLVAFVYDLMLRQESGGTTRLPEKYRELFSKYAAKAANGNEAIMSLLISSPATGQFLKSHVERKGFLDLEQPLKRYGLWIDSKGSKTHLRVADNLSEEQFRLLRTLGYERR